MNEIMRIAIDLHKQKLDRLNDIARMQRIELKNTEKQIDQVRSIVNGYRLQEAAERRNNENEAD